MLILLSLLICCKPIDSAREEQSFFSLLGTKFIRIYQVVFSSRQGDVCNFTPSCSNYAYEAIRKHGPLGVLMTFDRLERCNYFAWQYKDKYYKVKWVPECGYKLYDPIDSGKKKIVTGKYEKSILN